MRAKKTKTKKPISSSKKKNIVHKVPTHHRKEHIRNINAADLIDRKEEEPPKFIRKGTKKKHHVPLFLYFFIVMDIILIGYILFNNPYTEKTANGIFDSIVKISDAVVGDSGSQTSTSSTSTSIPLDNIDTYIYKERKIFKSTTYNYQVSYLVDWTIASNQDSPFIVYKNKDKATPPYFSVSVMSKPAGNTMDMVVTNEIKAYRQCTSIDNIYFFGHNALKLKIDRSKCADKTNQTYAERVYLNEGSLIYKIEAVAQSKALYEEDRVDLENSFSSFKIGQ